VQRLVVCRGVHVVLFFAFARSWSSIKAGLERPPINSSQLTRRTQDKDQGDGVQELPGPIDVCQKYCTRPPFLPNDMFLHAGLQEAASLERSRKIYHCHLRHRGPTFLDQSRCRSSSCYLRLTAWSTISATPSPSREKLGALPIPSTADAWPHAPFDDPVCTFWLELSRTDGASLWELQRYGVPGHLGELCCSLRADRTLFKHRTKNEIEDHLFKAQQSFLYSTPRHSAHGSTSGRWHGFSSPSEGRYDFE